MSYNLSHSTLTFINTRFTYVSNKLDQTTHNLDNPIVVGKVEVVLTQTKLYLSRVWNLGLLLWVGLHFTTPNSVLWEQFFPQFLIHQRENRTWILLYGKNLGLHNISDSWISHVGKEHVFLSHWTCLLLWSVHAL